MITLDQVLSGRNILRAIKQVVSNKGAPGIDGMTVDQYEAHHRRHWRSIAEHIRAGSYIPAPVRRVDIPKPNGGTRMLGIPTVQDRVIQQAIAQILVEAYDPHFSNAFQAAWTTGLPPNWGQGDPWRFSWNPKYIVWSSDSWEGMFSGFNFLGKRDVKEPDFAYAPNAERLGIKFEHNAANAPVALNGSLKIEETRAVPGISAKLNTIAKIRGEYVIASKYDFWFLNADLSPKFHAAMDPWFSANVLDLVGITALDKDAYVLMGSNKSLLRVRQNPEADDVQGWPNFTAGRSHIEAVGGLGRARIDTERAKFSYIHSSATDGRYVFMATVPDNKNKKQFVISKALMKDWMLSGEFVPTAEMLKKDRSLGELYVTGMVYEDGKLYAVSKNWNVLVVIDVAQEAVVEAWGLPEELTDIRGLVKDGSTFEVIDANRVVKLTM